MERVIVVGAGVVGLSCAVRLLEAGHEVHVLARDLPSETTSAVSAAMWYPFAAAPAERVTSWGHDTFDAFCRLAEAEPGSGVRLRGGVEMLRVDEGDPDWTRHVRHFHRLDDVPEPYVAARRFTTPVADMSRYLPWLRTRIHDLGGTLTRIGLNQLPHPAAGVVVDTAGLGARVLASDPSVTPLRGQVVIVAQFGLEEWALDERSPTYVVPREKTVVVGGTSQVDDWSIQPDEDVARSLLLRAEELLLRTHGGAVADRFRRAPVVGHKVGLRPARPSVRLEEQWRDGVRVVHCYGHGSAGMTLSWGCAREVASLIE